MVSLGDTAISLHILQLPRGGGCVFCQRSDLDSGKKIGVWKWGGGVLPKVRFGIGEENWSLEILGGGCSAKGQIWTWGRKLEFFWGGGVFCTKFQNRVFLPIWSKNSGSPACLCITGSLSHTTYVETKKGIQQMFTVCARLLTVSYGM